MKHHLVVLDGFVKPPPLDFDIEITQHISTSPTELPERVKTATMIMTSNPNLKVTRAAIEAAPNLQMVNCNGVGYDHIDVDAMRDRGVTLCNVPAQNSESVSEHAFALYFALKRRVLDLHPLVMDGSTWARDRLMHVKMGRAPRTNAEETLVVLGYGSIGKNVEKIARALGMRVLIAERKGAVQLREGRTSFDAAVKQGTVFVVVAPLHASTRGMIGSVELSAMDPTALIINVGRGGVVDESALAQALKDGRIAGAATDVFEQEPATTENCALLDLTIPNLVLSPHIAWYSSKTMQGTMATIKANLEAFAAGRPINVVVSGTEKL